jgi:Tfp pilus assembly protein PilV
MRKRTHSAGQSLFEVMFALTILIIAVWGTAGFLSNGRMMVERSGMGIIAAQVAAEHVDRTRDLAYAAMAGGNGTETVNGTVYTWVVTVTNVQADPADAGSTFKQIGVTLSWPAAPTAATFLTTAVGQ